MSLMRVSQVFMVLLSRGARISMSIAVLAAVYGMWHFYGPLPGVVGTPLQRICYGAAGLMSLVTAIHPLSGIVLLAFCAPLLSAIPLALLEGATYPLLLFTAIAFVWGWLVRESVQGRELPWFRGSVWLWVFGALILISGAASFLRYNPPWQWGDAAFNQQAVNVMGMNRVDATRFVVFVCASMLTALGIIAAVSTIVQRYHERSHEVATFILWALLAGAVVSAGAAVYQAHYDLNFCANRSYYWTRLARANGFCTDPNALGTLLALSITLAALKLVFAGSLRSVRAWIQRVLALLVLGLYLIGLQYSGSRSGLLGALLGGGAALLCGGLYYGNILLRHLRVPWLVRCACGVVVLVVCAGAIQRVPSLLRYVDSRLSPMQTSSSLVRRLKRDLRLFQQEGNVLDMLKDPRRLLYWRYAKIMWREFPISGIGLGAYVIELPNYCAAASERLFRTDNACNYYLHYAAEMGTLGLLVLGCFYGTLLLGFVRKLGAWCALSSPHKHQRIVLALGLVTFLVVLIFGVHTMAEEVNIAFAILVGLVAADHEVVVGRRRPVQPTLGTVGGAVLALVILIYAWRGVENNRGRLNGERRMATFGLVSEAGWYAWETLEGVPFRVRWTGRCAATVLRRETNILAIPMLADDPSVTSQPQVVSIYLNGRRAAEHTFTRPGVWHLLRVAVPYADPFCASLPAHVAVRIVVSRTWVPRKVTGGDDDRTLGVLVGAWRWEEPIADGGWHSEENAPDGTPFRWSTDYAWCVVPVNTGAFINIPMYASNILLRRWPLRVAVYLNRQHLDTIVLSDKRWKQYRYPLPADLPSWARVLVELIPSRTWVPRHYGFEDSRALGVAVGPIRVE
ncbi:MAG: O-antigen ligase family protein [bacterium]|nr:O-antigen ligase family protein [bacterium]